MNDTAGGLRRLLDGLSSLVLPAPTRSIIDEARRRLDEPVRVAFVGEPGVGTSTLVDAVVGVRLGDRAGPMTWHRAGDRRFPSPPAALQKITIVEGTTRPLSSAFDAGDTMSAPADAVVHVGRYRHPDDPAMTALLTDEQVARSSPATALLAMTRADEVAAGLPERSTDARRAADRLGRHRRVRERCAAVVPVAGLVARAGRTLTAAEADLLIALAGGPPGSLATADGVARAKDLPGTPEDRSALVDLLGIYGVRLAVGAVRSGAGDATTLRDRLVEASGLNQLWAVIDRAFVVPGDTLRAAAAVRALSAAAADLAAVDPAAAADAGAELERLVATEPGFDALRLIELVLSGAARLGADDADAALRLAAPGPTTTRLGAGPGDDPRVAAVAVIDRWRALAAAPVADTPTRLACNLAARLAEHLYAAYTRG